MNEVMGLLVIIHYFYFTTIFEWFFFTDPIFYSILNIQMFYCQHISIIKEDKY